MDVKGNNPIYRFLSTWISHEPLLWFMDKHIDGYIMNKVTALNEVTASNEVIWPPQNFMHGLKSAILTIFQKLADWLCSVSAALHRPYFFLANHFFLN